MKFYFLVTVFLSLESVISLDINVCVVGLDKFIFNFAVPRICNLQVHYLHFLQTVNTYHPQYENALAYTFDLQWQPVPHTIFVEETNIPSYIIPTAMYPVK